MKHSEFRIGAEFTCGDGLWRCTDVGSRVIIAIRLDLVRAEFLDKDGARSGTDLSRGEAEADGWFNGPPYAVAEHVFDENDMPACEPAVAYSEAGVG